MKTKQFRFSITTLDFGSWNFESFSAVVELIDVVRKDKILQNRYFTSLSKVFNHSVSSTIYRYRWSAEWWAFVTHKYSPSSIDTTSLREF